MHFAQTRILIGGLGLGFTLAAVLDEFGEDGDITVAEISSDVLKWYRHHFQRHTLKKRNDRRVKFMHQDVQQLIIRSLEFDLILLDVDNGPEPVSTQGNRHLYSESGLRRIATRLNPGGRLLLWSGFESAQFVRTAKLAGFQIECAEIALDSHSHTHFIYKLYQSPQSVE